MKILMIPVCSSEKPIGKLMETEKYIAKSEEMESPNHRKNSSIHAVPSYGEEVSVNPQLNSSLDTVSLFQERKHRHYKSKYEHRRRKPSHQGNSVLNDKHKKYCKHRCEQQQQSSDDRNKLETVTKQKIIHVQQDNFKCIMQNTTVCDQNSINVEKSQCSKKHHRPIPQCQKPLCRSYRPCETKFHNSKESCKRPHGIEKALGKEIKKQFDQPPSRLDQDEDHFSNKSLEKYLDIPMSYKYVVKHSKKYESKLDTLIKRTKERERKLVEQSRNNNNASSPYTDISSGEFPTYSEYAASLHSRSTLILETQTRETGYSPNIESFYPIKTEKYSPTQCNTYLDSDFEMKIKSELIMDSGAYSPTQHPMQKLFDIEEWIKKDKD